MLLHHPAQHGILLRRHLFVMTPKHITHAPRARVCLTCRDKPLVAHLRETASRFKRPVCSLPTRSDFLLSSPYIISDRRTFTARRIKADSPFFPTNRTLFPVRLNTPKLLLQFRIFDRLRVGRQRFFLRCSRTPRKLQRFHDLLHRRVSKHVRVRISAASIACRLCMRCRFTPLCSWANIRVYKAFSTPYLCVGFSFDLVGCHRCRIKSQRKASHKRMRRFCAVSNGSMLRSYANDKRRLVCNATKKLLCRHRLRISDVQPAFAVTKRRIPPYVPSTDNRLTRNTTLKVFGQRRRRRKPFDKRLRLLPTFVSNTPTFLFPVVHAPCNKIAQPRILRAFPCTLNITNGNTSSACLLCHRRICKHLIHTLTLLWASRCGKPKPSHHGTSNPPIKIHRTGSACQ